MKLIYCGVQSGLITLKLAGIGAVATASWGVVLLPLLIPLTTICAVILVAAVVRVVGAALS